MFVCATYFEAAFEYGIIVCVAIYLSSITFLLVSFQCLIKLGDSSSEINTGASTIFMSYHHLFFSSYQHNIRRGEAPAEGEEQDGNEETGHCFLGLRGVWWSTTKSKALLHYTCLSLAVCLHMIVRVEELNKEEALLCLCWLQGDTRIIASPMYYLVKDYSLSLLLPCGV